MTTTEQAWLGNESKGRPGTTRTIEIGTVRRPRSSAIAARAISEADLIAGMKRALRPFRRPTAEPKQGWEFPRAGIRRRPDGRYQLRIWLDPMMTPDPVQGGACETIAEAYELGAMICHYARQAAA